MPNRSTRPPQQQATSHGTLGCMVIVLLFLFLTLLGIGYDTFYRSPQQLWQEKSKLIVWLALPFLLAALWLWYDGRHYRQLQQQGQLIQGEIINRFIRFDGEAGDSYYVEYLFTGGVATVQMVTKPLYDRLAVGAPVAILYLPADPKISCLQEN